jgi:hypothetical protein
MRIIRSVTVSTILAICLSSKAFALICPTVEQIQTQAAKDTGTIQCYAPGNCVYDLSRPIYTEKHFPAWFFTIDFNASSDDDAKNKARDALQSLVYKSGPTRELEKMVVTQCRYTTNFGATGSAIAFGDY